VRWKSRWLIIRRYCSWVVKGEEVVPRRCRDWIATVEGANGDGGTKKSMGAGGWTAGSDGVRCCKLLSIALIYDGSRWGE
jgi:hypothetical protein